VDRFERAGKLAAKAGNLIIEEMFNLQLKKALYPVFYETVCSLLNLLDNTRESGNEIVNYGEVAKELRNYDAKNTDEALAERWAFFTTTRPSQPTKAEIDAIQAYTAFTALKNIDPKRNKNTRKRSESEPRRNVRFSGDEPRDPSSAPKYEPPVQCMNCGSNAHSSKKCPQPQKTCKHCLKPGHMEKFCFYLKADTQGQPRAPRVSKKDGQEG
jgi:hypothetical protein